MTASTAKSTYTVDRETAAALEEVSRAWKVSQAEALRRAIQRARAEVAPVGGSRPLDALDALQASLALSPDAARAWERQVRAERRATGSEGKRPGRRSVRRPGAEGPQDVAQ